MRDLKNKIDILFTIGIVILGVFSMVKYFNSIGTISTLDNERQILLQRVDVLELNNSLENNLIGIKLKFDSLYILNRNSKYNIFDLPKIAIIADAGSCQPCYIKALNYYGDFIKGKNLFNSVNLFLVVPSKNIELVKRSYLKELSNKINIMIDTELNFSKELNIPIDNSAVLFLDKDNKCLYAYLVDREKPYKNLDKSKIFEKLLMDTDKNKNLSSIY